VLRSIVA